MYIKVLNKEGIKILVNMDAIILIEPLEKKVLLIPAEPNHSGIEIKDTIEGISRKLQNDRIT